MKVAFCGGGTGGHVYPALTVAAALRRQFEARNEALVGAAASEAQASAARSATSPPRLDYQARPEPGRREREPGGEVRIAEDAANGLDLLYIGVQGKIDAALVQREAVPFQAVSAGPLRVDSPKDTAQGVLKLVAGAAQAYSILGRFQPDVVFATGGYGSVGVGVAARLRGLPLLVFLPDVAAGLAVKTLVRIADRIAVSVQPAYDAMPRAKTVLTGYPVRPGFFGLGRDEARRQLGLHPDLPALLITGGSTGATSINRNVATWLPEFLQQGQVIQISGRNDHAWLQQERDRLPAGLRERYHLHAYLHEGMPLAMAAADLAVMRAGASTLGELPATGLPAVLIPGEFSDQAVNARYLEAEGAAVMLPQSRLAELQATVMTLLADDARRERMRKALGGLSRPDAAERLAELVMEMAK